jgi:site-specific DNA-methyltransferase (adenine-specific)
MNESKDLDQYKYFNEKNKFSLYLGDSLEILEKIPKNSIDMIFADPPYFLSNGGISCNAGKMVSVNKGDWDKSRGFNDDYKFHYKWLEACRRVLKPGGTIWVSGTYHSIYQCGHAIQALGYHILNDISWFKPNASPNLSCRFFTASHETIIWARKDKKGKHTFNYDEMRFWKDNYKKTIKLDKNVIQIEVLHEEGKQMRSVWAIGTPKPEEKIFGKHPTQKPIQLLKRIIISSTHKGGVVLDPFTGSSTTGLVAFLNDRKFIGIDMEKKYLDLSKKRLEELDKKLR